MFPEYYISSISFCLEAQGKYRDKRAPSEAQSIISFIAFLIYLLKFYDKKNTRNTKNCEQRIMTIFINCEYFLIFQQIEKINHIKHFIAMYLIHSRLLAADALVR